MLGNPADVVTATRPGIVLEGGGTDIDESFEWMIERSGGGDFVVLRSTGTDAYNPYIFDIDRTERAARDSVATLIVRSRTASFDRFVLDTIRNAESLWLAGGDQAKHVANWRRDPGGRRRQRPCRAGVPVGGTSSGLALMGEYAYSAAADLPADPHLSSTQALRDPFHPRLTICRDFLRFPYLDGALLEPHYVQESRFGRMAALLARVAAEGPQREVRGIGIDKQTALLLEPDGSTRVITGPDHPFGKVTLFRLTGSPEICKPGHPLTLRGMEALQFSTGDRPSLSHWGGARGTRVNLTIEKGVPVLSRLKK